MADAPTPETPPEAPHTVTPASSANGAVKRDFPVIATIIVVLLVLVMIGLGFWQLQRKSEKEALLAALSANLTRPAMSFPMTGPVQQAALFRQSSVMCLRVNGWHVDAGKAADGSTGFRYIAECVTGAEGPGALVALGVGARPDLKPAWNGGRLSGWISEEPDRRSAIARFTGHPLVLRPMLIAKDSHAGLKAPASPNAASIANNHFSYAIQWFLFAGIALVIYGLALGRRLRS